MVSIPMFLRKKKYIKATKYKHICAIKCVFSKLIMTAYLMKRESPEKM